MGTKELREKYNAASSRQAMARAIRAEAPDGDSILAAESQAHGRAARDGLVAVLTGRPTNAAHQLSNARKRRNDAEDDIRRRYNMPPRVGVAN